MTAAAAEPSAPGTRRRPTGPDGILVLDKPVGPTSHDIVALVRRLAGQRRIGHGGTLDPFASGVLPLYLGRATRLAEYHLGAAKAYRATVCFGAVSTTDDLEGELTPVTGPGPRREAVEGALAASLGTLIQQPPAYSARKVGGRRAYALARAGIEPRLEPRAVTIHRLALVDWDAADPDRPVAVVEVACSAGTYVRALARDLGAALGNGAYLGALRRTAAGPFTLADAVPLDAVRAAAAEGRLAALIGPVGAGLDGLPAVHLVAADAAIVVRGGWIRLPAGTGLVGDPAMPVRLLDGGGQLLAMARVAGGRLVPDKVLVGLPAEDGVPVPGPAGDAGEPADG